MAHRRNFRQNLWATSKHISRHSRIHLVQSRRSRSRILSMHSDWIIRRARTCFSSLAMSWRSAASSSEAFSSSTRRLYEIITWISSICWHRLTGLTAQGELIIQQLQKPKRNLTRQTHSVHESLRGRVADLSRGKDRQAANIPCLPLGADIEYVPHLPDLTSQQYRPLPHRRSD